GLRHEGAVGLATAVATGLGGQRAPWVLAAEPSRRRLAGVGIWPRRRSLRTGPLRIAAPAAAWRTQPGPGVRTHGEASRPETRWMPRQPARSASDGAGAADWRGPRPRGQPGDGGGAVAHRDA